MTIRTVARRSLLVGFCVLVAAIFGCIPSTIGVAVGSSGGGSSPPPAAVLTDLEISLGNLTPPFDASVTSYSTSVGFLTSSIRLTPINAPGLSISVNGVSVPTGERSPLVPLQEGNTTIVVRVENGAGDSRSYSIAVNRAAFGSLGQDGPLLKAPVPNAVDLFGWSVAVDGDTLVVGVVSEDGVSQGAAGNPAIVSPATANSGAVFVYRRAGAASPWLFEAYLKASNNLPNPPGLGDAFGSCVAISGDTIAVGAPGEDSSQVGVNSSGADDSAVDSGAVYVFQRSGTSWSQQAYVKASNPDNGDLFGVALSLEDDTLVVTASREDNLDGSQNNDGGIGLGTNAGAAYVFVRSGSTWTQQAYLKASGAEPASEGDGFGEAVALSGDTVAISAPGEDSTVADSGAVYVFQRTGSAWQQQAFLKMSNAGLQDLAGRSLGLDGDTLVVGVPEEDSAATGVGGNEGDNSSGDSGAAYVFVRSGTTWAQQAYLKASNTAGLVNFGAALSLRGDVIAVGALREAGGSAGVFAASNLAVQGGGTPDAGSVYLFIRSGIAWSLDAYLKATPNAPGSQFGYSVAFDGSTLVVGAELEGTSAAGSGAAYVFR